MSTFLSRLKVYAIGFGIGLIFVFFFFKNRGCSWLPDNRVKNSILDRIIVIQEDEAKKLAAKGIDNDEIIELLNDGDVDFKKSKKEGESKIYYVEKDGLKVYFTLPQQSIISEVRLANQPVSSIVNSKSGQGKFIHFPKDDNLVFADSTKSVTCRQQAIGMIEAKKILKSIEQNGAIDFTKTDFSLKKRSAFIDESKALQYIYFNDPKGRRIGAEAVWYKNKLTIVKLDLPFEADCQ